MADDTQEQLHVVMFPWLAFGHFIPFLELAGLIARKGHRVSFISTPKNIQRLRSNTLSSLVHFVTFNMPRLDDLPETMESTMDGPPDKIPLLILAFDALRDQFSGFLSTTTPDWIVYDLFAYWLPDIAAHHGVARAFFFISTFYSLAFSGPCRLLMDDRDPRGESPEKFTVPPEWVPFPTTVAYRLHESRQNIEVVRKSSIASRFGFVIHGCDVCFARGTYELDAHWIDLCREINHRPMIPVGPMPTPSQDVNDDVWPEIRSWLDHQDRGSVLYVAFGSEAPLTQSGLTELAEGLALSGSPFLWVLRKQSEVEVEVPDGFEDRVKGRGLVWRGWAPQIRILGHASVGGFLTHCGPSSVKEALQFGHPLIMLPLIVDQPLVARVMSGELKVGVEIERDEETGSFVRESVAEPVRWLMRGEQGRGCREKAREMMKIYGNQELQEKYTAEMVEYLRKHQRGRHPGDAGESR